MKIKLKMAKELRASKPKSCERILYRFGIDWMKRLINKMTRVIEKANGYANSVTFEHEYFMDRLWISEKQWNTVRPTVLKEINRIFTDKGYKVSQIIYGYVSSTKYAIKIDWSE